MLTYTFQCPYYNTPDSIVKAWNSRFSRLFLVNIQDCFHVKNKTKSFYNSELIMIVFLWLTCHCRKAKFFSFSSQVFWNFGFPLTKKDFIHKRSRVGNIILMQWLNNNNYCCCKCTNAVISTINSPKVLQKFTTNSRLLYTRQIFFKDFQGLGLWPMKSKDFQDFKNPAQTLNFREEDIERFDRIRIEILDRIKWKNDIQYYTIPASPYDGKSPRRRS